MNELVALYQWVREGHKICLADIVQVHHEPYKPPRDVEDEEPDAPAGPQDKVSLEMRVTKTLWGKAGQPLLHATIVQPENSLTRLKFPDPIWGRVDPKVGVRLLLVSESSSETELVPVYVEEIRNPQDPALLAIERVLESEQDSSGDRFKRYLAWVADPQPVLARFTAEALAKDTDLTPFDHTRAIPSALITAFTNQRNPAVRVDVGGWIWDDFFPRTEPKWQIAILNMTIAVLEDSNEAVSQFAFDRLLTLEDPKLADDPAIGPNHRAAAFLAHKLPELTEPGDRSRIERLVHHLAR